MIDHHTALIYTMVLVSAADEDMTDAELRKMGEIISSLPVFKDYDRENLTKTARDCAKLLVNEDGLEKSLDLIEAALPERLRETAYVLACDVAAADGHVSQEELRLLQMICDRLEVERLAAAAIERAARARHATI